jgi:hypothetical protein
MNINLQLPGQKPAFFNNNNVGSLANPTFNKQADVVDLLSRTLQARVANKMLDKVVESGESKKSPSHNKEIEITSKYPEMANILKNEENKAYLERLLKE